MSPRAEASGDGMLTEGGAPVRPGLLVLALALGVTTLSLLQSLVVPVLGPIARELHVSAGAAGWVLTANLLAAAVLTPVLGRLGDVRGERPVILAILTAVTLGTVLSILTTSLPLLLVARVLQGSSFGLFPLSISVLRRELPGHRLTVAMSVVSSTLAVGGVVGLVVTGLLTGDNGDYHRPFWVGFGVGLVALLLAVRLLPSRPPSATGRVDGWGAVLLGAGLVLLLLPLSQASSWGWTSPVTIGALVASALVLTGWVLLQRRRAQPLVRPALLTDRRMLVPNVAGLMTGVCIFVSFLGVLQFVRTPPELAGYGFGASALAATLIYLLPGGIVGIGIAPLAGRVVTRAGALPTLFTSGVVGLAGFALLVFLRDARWAVAVAGLLTQIGITVAYAALPALVVQAVQRDETGVANAVNSIARSVGQALGSTVAVAVLAGDLDPASGLPRASAYTLIGLIGMLAAAAVAASAVAGRRTRQERRPDDLADVEAATAGAGEWSPVSGLH